MRKLRVRDTRCSSNPHEAPLPLLSGCLLTLPAPCQGWEVTLACVPCSLGFVHTVPTSSAQTVVDRSLGPQSWVRSICWLYEQIKEDTESLVLWAALTCSEGGPGSASAGDLLDMQALGLTPNLVTQKLWNVAQQAGL